MIPLRVMPNAFEWLLGLYSDNYLRLQRLLDAKSLAVGRYINACPGKSDLILDVLEQQPYTSLLRLSLRFVESQPSEDPESYWRVYHDAKQAEVTHCRFDAHRVRLFAPNTPARLIAHYRRRMNSFANKWLEQLIDDGYASDAWELSGPVPEWNRVYTTAPGEEADWDESAGKASSGRRREARSA